MEWHARNPSRKAAPAEVSVPAVAGSPVVRDAPQTLPAQSARAGVQVGCDLLYIVFRSMTDGVFTIDRDFVITSFNPAAERITGFSAREAIGKRCFEVLRADVCQRRCVLRETLTTEDPVENVRVTIITQDGVERPIVLNATVLRDERGEIVGAVEFFHDLRALEHLQLLAHEHALQRIVRGSPAMNRIIEMLPNIAASDCSVLIAGPSGSGKELIAQAIHSLSARRFGPYVRLNCAALPATLLESELFGYEKGAFTDARRDKPGHFALANGGTLLLDEITEMEPALQVKLLRVLNNGEYQPLGSTKTLRTDARIIASTNADIPAVLRSGRLREDLYFRINVVTIELPPLCERREDIPLLVEHFLHKFAAKTGKPIRSISPRAIGVLCRHCFPGNVRELENAIEHAFVMCQGEMIEAEHLPLHTLEGSEQQGTSTEQPDERRLIEQALRRHSGNRTRAAEELGMHRSTLWRKLKSLSPSRI